MTGREKMDFCTECRKDTEYVLKKKTITKTIKDTEYQFEVTTAVCAECGEEISIPGLIDRNIKEVDEQYRMVTGIVTTEDIGKLMKIYQIGKAPLSLALGFGEVTITRYLAGQVPSKEYSDIIRAALTSPSYMKRLLTENKDRIADAAYNRAMTAAEEVTPLMLQKLLYFIQGIYSALCGRPMFAEDCEAWVHGPVYPEVYNLFRDFKYNPIEDARFAVLYGTAEKLTEEEKKVIDLVLDTFGVYGGKTLERITHSERPWREARKGYDDNIHSNAMLKKESISAYYGEVDEKYGIDTREGIRAYIRDRLG